MEEQTVVYRLTFMKKNARRDHVNQTSRQSDNSKTGRWSFNLATESLFTLGSTEQARRVAYRTATGEIRFLPL